jgi:hypothetical protein
MAQIADRDAKLDAPSDFSLSVATVDDLPRIVCRRQSNFVSPLIL